jgi:rhodanese-related sulfurtransferase
VVQVTEMMQTTRMPQVGESPASPGAAVSDAASSGAAVSGLALPDVASSSVAAPSVAVPDAASSSTVVNSAVLSIPAAANADALAHFAARLSFETDVSDVHADLELGLLGRAFTLVDSRSVESWEQGHVPGAVHLPTRLIAQRAESGTLDALLPAGTTVVTYCWGPGCNGAAKAALALARLGYPVKEMIGGFEYWVREGFAYESKWGMRHPATDPLTAPADGAACGC